MQKKGEKNPRVSEQRPSRNDLTQGSVSRHLLRLTIPFSIALFAVISGGLVDSIYLGHLSAKDLAAMGFLIPVMFAINSISIGLGAGASSVVARSIGEGDTEKQKRRSTASFLLAFLVMSFVAFCLFFNIKRVFSLFGASEDVMPYIQNYMRFWIFSPIALSIPMMTNNILRAKGSTVWASFMLIFAAIINIVLDPFFIFGLAGFPKLGIMGASLSTLLSQIGGVCIAGILIWRFDLISIKTLNLHSIFRSWKEIAYIGLPAALTNAIGPISTAIATAAIAYALGDAAVAGFGAGIRVEMFILSPLYAMSAAIGPMTGQNGGAGLKKRVRQSFTSAFMILFVWSLGIGIILILCHQFIASLFSKDLEIISVISQYFIIIPISLAGYGMLIVTSAGFNALGRPMIGLLLSAGRSFLLYAPGVWIGAFLIGTQGAFLGIALSNILLGLICVFWTLARAPMTVRPG